MNRGSRKSFLTVRERVLVHLLPFQRYYQDADAPRAVTQDGISQATGVGRNNVTKVLTGLEVDGTLEITTKRVKGLPSVRKVYFLTQEGFEESLALKRELETTRITIVGMRGEKTEDEVGRLPLFLPKQYSFLELAMGVVRGVFDCQSFHEGKIKEERRFVDYTDRKPVIRSFFGRSQELGRLSMFLASGAKVLVVQGIAGIGKTSLLAKFAQDQRDQANIFWFKLHEWVDVKGFLRPLGEFLSQLGKEGLELYLAQADAVSVSEVCHVLEAELRDISAIWILDDVQKVAEEVVELLSALMALLETLPGIKMLCSSREVPAFYTRSAVLGGLVQELVLEGLDRESSLQLMREHSIPEGWMEELYRITRGHPLFLELVEDPRMVLGKNVRMFVAQEIYSKLDAREKRILEVASIFRYPIPVDAFFIVEEEMCGEQGTPGKESRYKDHMVDHDTVDTLIRKSLLLESTGRTLGMHDVVREFFYSRLAPRLRVQYHRAASRYYLQDAAAPSNVEALYHSISANECAASVRIAAGNGREIVSKGYSSLLSPLLNQLLAKCGSMQSNDRMEILLLQAEAEYVQGDWDKSLLRYQEIEGLASPERDKRVMAEAYRRIGVIHLRRYAYDEALTYLERSKILCEVSEDEHTLTEVLYDLGGVMERKGAIDEALQFFSRSERLAAKVGEDVNRGKAFYGLGRAYAQKREMQKAIAYKRSALEVLERTGELNEIAKVCSSLGSDLLNEGKKMEAINYLERSVDLANSIGDLNTMSYALANLAASYIEVGNLDRAELLLDQANVISIKLNEKLLIAAMHLYRGYLYAKRGEWEWAKESFSTALDSLRAINVPTRLSYWLYEIAQVYLENGDFEGARILLDEAVEIARSLGQYDLLKDLVEIQKDVRL